MNFAGEGISHLWTLHIYNLSSWALLKTQNFLCSYKTLDTTILLSDFSRWYSDVLFFPQQKPFGYVMYILSCTNLRWKKLLQHPSDAILKAVCHKLHYDSKRILSWDCISFSLHKAFCHKSRLATFYIPSGVMFLIL